MSDDEKTAAAIAFLGIAALAHHDHHYECGYKPADDVETAEFERGYRDGLHGYSNSEQSRTTGYVNSYKASQNERNNSIAHLLEPASQKAPLMAYSGWAEIIAQSFAVGRRDVHFVKAQSPQDHEWEIEATVGNAFMVCTMRDPRELIDQSGGKL